ncbi:GNAT family N-acetyltransferase [Roseibium sp. TrichSKD4]|uniref:GNAT family N-acetyltransferase n=1 Tax=Roseibium sp. TrichSKD4 TaxID=744980 RepID=UPI00143A75F8|nr:GNAT family N-acetyltransferase [Roseibium sp. TrichSKD4]
MSNITGLRSATLNDVEVIAKIHVQCWREVYGFMPREVHDMRDLSYRRNQWNCWFQERPDLEALFVLLHNDNVVGFAISKPNHDDAIDALGEFHACYILPEFRGGQAGPMAMMALALSLKENNLWPACVWAFKQNPYRRIYPMLGCRPLVYRDRSIGGANIPEIGYHINDYNALMSRLDRMRVSAEKRQIELPQKLVRQSRLVG